MHLPIPPPLRVSPRRLATAFLLLTLATAALATSPMVVAAGGEQGYSLRTWRAEDGLPQNIITAIAETSDGYIWLGSYGGLSRTDGVRFVNFDATNTPGLVDSRIVSLFADDTTLWIGHDSGNLTCYRDGRFTPVPSPSPHRTKGLIAIDRDAAGAIWLLRSNGVLESPSDGRSFPFPGVQPNPTRLALARTAEGALLVECDGRVAQLADDGLHALDFGTAQRSDFVMRIGPARERGFWVVRDFRVQRWSGHSRLEDRGATPWEGSTAISALRELHDGTIAAGTFDQGLYLLFRDGKSTRIDRATGLPQHWIRTLCEDVEGNLWVGTGSAGLAQLVPSRFTVVDDPELWQGHTALAAFVDRDDSLWIGSEGAGLYRLRDGFWTHFSPEAAPEMRYIWSLAQDADGTMWAGTWSTGLFRQAGRNFVRVEGFDPADGPIFALQHSATDNALWIGCARGLLRWPDAARDRPPQPLGSPPNVCTFARDRDGVVWYGIVDGGLGRLAAGQHRLFRKADGLSSNSVQCLYADTDGTLWIGTSDGGLNRLRDGRFSPIGVSQGLASNTICHIADDGDGNLWLSTHHGIVRVAKTELHRCADGLVRKVDTLSFDHNDGLPTIELSGGLHAAGARSRDGRLWFTSSKGVVSIDPKHLRINLRPPPVLIEKLSVDGREFDFAGGLPGPITLRPQHQRLVFDYTALSLSAPDKMRFRYRLAGVDDDWIDAGAKRSATYSHLPAGTYTFRVIASNNDGFWNTAGASLALTVDPFYWQTWWFRSLAVILGLGTAALAARAYYHRRLRLKVEALHRRHAIERERSRIAQDIHDDIGASLTRIMMLSQCAQPGDARTGPLARIYTAAHDITTSLDEIVWAINPRHDSLDSLVSYMVGEFAQSLLAEAGLRCRLDLPVALPHWPLGAEIRHNLFLAFKEALNNCIRHARATEVQIALAVQPDEFVLSIADDGCGFDSTASRAPTNSHDGLANLQARLAKIGGRCDIESRPGHGTRIAFTLSRLPQARA